MNRYEIGSLDDRPDFYEVKDGTFVRFEDVQQLARECIDPIQVALVEAFINKDDEFLRKTRELLVRIKAIAGAA